MKCGFLECPRNTGAILPLKARRRSRCGRHPWRVRVDGKRRGGKGNTVGHAGVLAVQPLRPVVPRQPIRQRRHAEPDQAHAQRSAQQGCVEQIGQKMIEAEPECRGCRELGVAAADDAASEQAERRDEHHAAGGQMGKVRRSLEAANAIIAGNSASLIASATMIMSSRAYLNASWTKVALSFEPSPCTTAMIATEMPAATRPYSTAVAPDSSFTKRFTRLSIDASTVHN